MRKASFHVLRVGVAITFLWIGVLIFKAPESWAGYIQPWLSGLFPFSLKIVMLGVAVLDILIGFFLLIDYLTWLAALIGSLHLIVILVVSGIDPITVRDIGLLAATVALLVDSFPFNLLQWT